MHLDIDDGRPNKALSHWRKRIDSMTRMFETLSERHSLLSAAPEDAAGTQSTDASEFGMTEATARPIVQFIARLQRDGGLKGTDIANFTGVSKATVSRWGSGRKSPHPKTQLIMSDLAYVVMRLSEYYSREEVRAWLYARHPQLGGQRAIDLIHDERTEDVIAILDRLDSDAYL